MNNKKGNRPVLSVGDIVKSTAGRGCGRLYLVVEEVDDEYVRICDGRSRKLENPKLKKNMHLLPVGKVDIDTAALYDAEIRNLLKEV
ncbi:MAG: KOW domain-containing RNA-binding protein [Clostridiales bacterium]|nr:KOW domain-containing RNA-binding protein [Clostridiales bacterium]